MHLESLRIQDFRNIAEADLAFCPGLNLLTGANGQGKSNLLEAVGLLATGRSFRRATPTAMRRHGQPWFRLNGRTRAGGLSHQIDFFGQSDRQKARLNGKPMRSVADMGAALAAVVIAPDSLALIRGGPAERRDYLDWVIFSRGRGHAALSRDYRHALRARNLLLQRGFRQLAEIEAWEDRLAELGGRISVARREMTQRLCDHLEPRLAVMAAGGGALTVRLGCQLDRIDGDWDDVQEAAARYRRLLAENRPRERITGVTATGPHRDELKLRLDGRPIARFGSQGQQKRFLLALKLAEGALLAEALGEPPLFLLDDPASELDREGMDLFMAQLAESGGQIFITACHAGEITWPGAQQARFAVSGGSFDALKF